MNIAKVFQSGNSQAVRLPKEMRLNAREVSITRRGDALILRPLTPPPNLAGAFDALADVTADFLPEGREQGPAQDRGAL